MQLGYTFNTNSYGECVVVEYNGCFNVRVRFEDTGAECITTSDQIRKGTVKDRFAATLCGVGYLGAKVPYIGSVYQCWVNMIKRCYDESLHDAHPTYKGCSVCEEWLSFESYYIWYVSNYIDGFELDKDKKVKGNKIYSPDTCSFISAKENIQLAHARSYELTHKDGRIITITNMRKFSRDNNLSNSGMFRVKSGERKSHKGWIKVRSTN